MARWRSEYHMGCAVFGRAGDETRTRDVLLGKEVLYH
jgi:hypothetical protein